LDLHNDSGSNLRAESKRTVVSDFSDTVSECSYAESLGAESLGAESCASTVIETYNDLEDLEDSVWTGFDHHVFHHSDHSPVLSPSSYKKFTKDMALAEGRLESILQKGIIRRNPHQAFGSHWLVQRELHPDVPFGVRGGILADDMGLGKTIQMISLMCANRVPSTLIVVPLALIHQWQSEINKFSELEVIIYHGQARARMPISLIRAADVVITTYGEITRFGSDIARVPWNRLIFDEAHHLRNKKTRKHKAAAALARESTWLITGTPINNSIKDLVNLLRICRVPLEVTLREDFVAVIAPQFILIRTKSQAGIVLPALSITNLTVPWRSSGEKQLAADAHASLSFSNASGHCSRFTATSSLIALINARQSCVLPSLMMKRFKKDIASGTIKNSEDVLSAIQSGDSKLFAVSKFILSRKQQGRPAIVFCQFRFEMELLASMLSELNVLLFHGGTKMNERREILTQTPDALIIQIQTGCEGLNLQQFRDVIFVSPHWNPAVHDQAIARAHRIGQTGDVQVYSFLMESCFESLAVSIDSYIVGVQDKKREIAETTLSCCR
jgi:SNF2 family DNA or RNA helicase